MRDFIASSSYFGLVLSLGAYSVGMALNSRFKLAVFNPLLISIVLTILVLITLGIDYETYNASAKFLSYLLTPATVCLAVPL